ncbi:MAG: Ppx/GppA phosphatase family protein [Flavobacteriales bacterium]
MKFAAIDIGSNAVRLLVSQVIEIKGETYFQKVSFTRVPIRLGEDVFEKGRISVKKAKSLVRTMKAFWYLMDVQDVIDFRACATSAMREASNGAEVIAKIKEEANVGIDLISGSEEANLIFGNFRHQKIDKKKNYLYIDVGGGSTELSIIKGGKRVKAKSFKIGTVRALKGKVKPAVWADIEDWVKEELKSENKLTGIGTGGNINRLYKMSSCKMNAPLTLQEMKELHKRIEGYSWEERISELRLKPDRADVITHASQIYMNTMELAGVKKMIVPRVGLSDGIIIDLYKKHS